jgi:tripartite-type tricarboxylate transporter receptor subunit TctC
MGPIDQAVELGEVQGRVTAWEGTKSTRRHWLTTNYVVHLATIGLTREPDLPKIPTIVELAPTAEAKQVLSFLSGNGTLGRMFLAPPGTNPKALKILRKALMNALNDPKYRARASSQHITVSPLDWHVLLRDVKRVMGTNQSTVDLTNKVLEK